ncbi:hypothetical protein Bbelb_075590 [Branchiostoma belcheri]|nr:hypothetical protein Bbelb_075590 [Branchiostoma belcheri]
MLVRYLGDRSFGRLDVIGCPPPEVSLGIADCVTLSSPLHHDEAHSPSCLQRHFSAWYRLIVARRVQYGKARAMADWKSTLRAWNAWRTYVLSRKTDKETRKYQRDLIDMQRKQQAAVDHDRRRVLQRCLQAWVLYVHWEQDRKELYRKQEETSPNCCPVANRSKMSALLEAAASGKLCTSGRGGVRSDRVDNGQRRVDELFEEPVKRQASAPLVRTDRSDPTSTRSEKDRGRHGRRLVKPTEPWQVNKKHLGLSNNTLAHLTPSEMDNQDNRQEKEKLTQPKKPYIPNTYEHRYTHQQHALEEQKRQIKEQKRLIEELQEQQRLIMCQQDMQKATAAREAIEEAIAGQGSKGKRAGSRPDSARSDSTDASSAMSQTDTCVSGPSTAVSRSSSSKTRNKALREADPIVKSVKWVPAFGWGGKKRWKERRELEKQERLERQAELNTRADEHYRNSLLRNRGWAAWRKLVNQSRHNMQVAVAHHTEELLRRCLVPWYDHTQEVLQHKADMATEFCNFITVRRCFRSWRRYGQHQSILEARAERHRQLRMREKCFRVWMDYAMDERLAGIEKDRMAVEHNVIRLQKQAFRAWQQLPGLQLAEDKEDFTCSLGNIKMKL